MKDISKLKENGVLSENAHYKVIRLNENTVDLIHLESDSEVNIDYGYLSKCIQSGDEYDTEIKVGREDKFWTENQLSLLSINPDNKQPGDLKRKGIRTIWEEIHTSQVFTVCFKKSDKVKTQKAIKAELDYAISLIDKAKKDKKSMAEAYKIALEHVQNNPISAIEEGEERILRGYKIQFTSRDGKYNCVDMDIADDNNIRPVNINSIQWLIFNNTKYIVE